MTRIKKAILTGGGRATRLRPITSTINKHLVPLANKPMIFHAIERVVEAGIEEIYINVNPEENQLQKYVGDGGHWGVKITYYVQEGGPQGVAHVVKCAERFIGDDPFLFYLSDNVISQSLQPFVDAFHASSDHCRLAFTPVPDPERSGVPRFDSAGKLLEIIEKPAQPPCNLIMTGIMLYGPKVFFEAYRHLNKSARGEYEISAVNTYLLQHGYRVGHEEIGWWRDTGLAPDLLSANTFLLDAKPASEFIVESNIPSGATLTDRVALGVGTTVTPDVIIHGPAIIGPNCTLEHCTIGPYVTVGNGTTIKHATITNSIIFSNCLIDSPIHITDSLIGESVVVKQEPARTKHRIIVGDHTHITH